MQGDTYFEVEKIHSNLGLIQKKKEEWNDIPIGPNGEVHFSFLIPHVRLSVWDWAKIH